MKTQITSLKAKFNSAFSLVELLVVIAVIAVIAAIAIPNITGTREAAVGARDSYNQAAVDRVVSEARAAGASSNDITTLLSSGTVTFTPQGLTNAVTFKTGVTNATSTQ